MLPPPRPIRHLRLYPVGEYEAASDGIVANVVIGAQGDVSTYVAEADRMTRHGGPERL
jgi:hypothetical protein